MQSDSYENNKNSNAMDIKLFLSCITNDTLSDFRTINVLVLPTNQIAELQRTQVTL